MNNDAINIYVFFEDTFLFLLGMYLGVYMLDHVIIRWLSYYSGSSSGFSFVSE